MKPPLSLPRAWAYGLLAVTLISVSLNLMVAGWLLGQRMAAPERMERGMLRQIAQSLPEEVRAPLREEVRSRRGELFRAFRALRVAREEVRAAIGAEPFDRERLAAALAEQRRRMNALQTQLHEAMLATASDLDAEARQRWSEARLWQRQGPLPELGEREARARLLPGARRQ